MAQKSRRYILRIGQTNVGCLGTNQKKIWDALQELQSDEENPQLLFLYQGLPFNNENMNWFKDHEIPVFNEQLTEQDILNRLAQGGRKRAGVVCRWEEAVKDDVIFWFRELSYVQMTSVIGERGGICIYTIDDLLGECFPSYAVKEVYPNTLYLSDGREIEL